MEAGAGVGEVVGGGATGVDVSAVEAVVAGAAAGVVGGAVGAAVGAEVEAGGVVAETEVVG